MKAKWLLSIIAVIALVLSISPSIALADTGGTATGSFGCGNSAPEITSVSLHLAADDTAATAMTPQTEYYVKVTVGDANTLSDLDTVTVYIFYDANGTYAVEDVPGSGNTQTCAILEWTNPNTWTIDPSDSTSWTKETSTVPTLTGASGDFEFNFKPGKVATETTGDAKWHIYVEVDDGTATDTSYQDNRTMNWYGEITVNTATVNWGDVPAGIDFGEDTDSEEGSISVKYLANGDYDEKIAASETWTGAPSGTATIIPGGSPSANEFSLKADDTGTLPSGSDGLVTIYDTWLTIDTSGDQTDEAGDTVGTNTIWLKLGTPFVGATYSGTIYYQIADGS